MKTIRLFSLLAMASLLIFSSCKKDKDNVSPGNGDPGASFFVKIDGKEFQSKGDTYAFGLSEFPAIDDYYAVYGLSSVNNDLIYIALPATTGTGTFKMDDKVFAIMSEGMEAFSSRIEPGSGTVTITKKTATQVVGTFSFTAFNGKGDKRTFSEGSFDVRLRKL